MLNTLTEGFKQDAKKPRTDLIPTQPLLDVAEVFRIGSEKYTERNWEKGMAWHRPYGALLRHLFAWWGGESKDKETGLSHLAHACCELMFLMEYESKSIGADDRPSQKTIKTAEARQ